VPPLVDTEDLIDAQGVAELLGLSQRNSVSGYQRAYPDMPRPVLAFGNGRLLVWRRSEIVAWLERRGPVRRGRPHKEAASPNAARPRPTSGRNPSK